MRIAKTIFLLLGATTLVSPMGWAAAGDDLRAFVGGRAAKLVVVDRDDGGRMYLLDTEGEGTLRKLADDIACNSPLLSPDGTRVVYNKGGKVYTRPLDGGEATAVVDGWDGHWWVDEQGDEWIYYSTAQKDIKLRWPDNKGIESRRIRLKDGKREDVVAWRAGGGPSKDGTHVGAGYASVMIFDLVQNQHYLLYAQGAEYGQGCNPSMSPDNNYLLMHLDLPHDTFSVRDKSDRLVWQIDKPAGKREWEFPEWSTDGDYAVASGVDPSDTMSVYVVRLSTKETMAVVEGGGDWTYPHLWIADSKPVPRAVATATEPPAADARAGSVADASAGAEDAGIGNNAASRGKSSGGCSVAPPSLSLLSCLMFLSLLALLRRQSKRRES